MRLRDLEPTFLRLDGDGFRMTEEREGADGLMFLCPPCFTKNGGPKGTEVVIVWFKHVDLKHSPGPGRWSVTGTTFDDLTLDPSIAVGAGGEHWHGYVRHGEIVT